MKRLILLPILVMTGLCFYPFASYADDADFITQSFKACTWSGKGYNRNATMTASCTASPGGASQLLVSEDGLKAGAQCKFTCVAEDKWKITVEQEDCKTGYTVRPDARGCVKAEQEKCTLTDGTTKKMGEWANSVCSSTKLASIPHLKPGAMCRKRCGANGWESPRLNTDSCEAGYAPSQDGSQCVAQTTTSYCANSGGSWVAATNSCDCDVAKGLQLKSGYTDRCECRNNMVWSSSAGTGGACVNPDTLRTTQQEEKHQQQQQQAAQAAAWRQQSAANKRKACTDSGGTMPGSTCVCDAAKFMVLSSGVCTCMPGYEWATPGTPSHGCKVTPTETLKRACDAATNADWNATTQKCVCKDADYELDVNAQTCKPIAALAECQPLMSKNKARWDATSKTCSCTQAGYAIVNGDCVETEEAATARKDKEMKSAKNKIEDVHSKLKRVQDGFKVSAWKNEEGKFNTARLASDSIAGVVLGTAGGLVTSKVVKKNQVENGFEDIQCTIGGQTVAQWGDDFSVGTQF